MKASILLCFLLLSFSLENLVHSTSLEHPWSFIVVADWHSADYFTTKPDNNSSYYKEAFAQISYINQTYGGDLMVLVGDTNGALPSEKGGGKWDRENFAETFKPELGIKKRIYQAGQNCYGTVKKIFAEAGYKTLYVALGDHELGGNSWSAKNDRKLRALPAFRKVFGSNYNTYSKFQEPIGSVPSRPIGTQFEYTSFAHKHKNVLFITIDAFKKLPKSLMSRRKGLGGEGVITCTVTKKHLTWFRQVLIAAREDDSIKYIIVQSHIPVSQPVRKMASTGQFMDYGEKSFFWKAMVDYNVDLYLAGDVHANTVTKDPGSNLLQVVSRGNQFNNFLNIEVTDHKLTITSYNEVGTKRMNNKNYIAHGRLVVDKSGCVPNANATSGDDITCSIKRAHISASGVLAILDRTSALVHFNFQETLPLGSRQVLGLQHNDHLDTLVARSITIRGMESNESLPNFGSFGQQYDAQIANVNIVCKKDNRCYGAFTKNSRLGIFANGPHFPSSAVSYGLWMRTRQVNRNSEMVLVHYGHNFVYNVGKTKKDIFTLTLRNGTPILYTSANIELIPRQLYNLNDNKWHHIAVSMPTQSCKLSDVIMYIDGKRVKTKRPPINKHIFFITSGRLSIGGFGHSSEDFESAFPALSPFVGWIDKFYMWTRSIEEQDFERMGVHFLDI